MGKFSVFINGISDRNNFLNNLFTEICSEISTELKNNKILFLDVDDNNTDELCDVLAKNILDEFSKKKIMKIINKNYAYLSKNDKHEVWNLSMRRILNDKAENNSDYLYRIKIIKNKLKLFLKCSACLSIEGFINFRLQEMEDDYIEVVEECVQDYLLELEYVEFINVIKYFLSIQSSRYLVVAVIYDDTTVLYADGKNITKECINDFNREGTFANDNMDDFLLNSLISIAPKRVIIKEHRKLNDEIKKTLFGIFGDKLKITTE